MQIIKRSKLLLQRLNSIFGARFLFIGGLVALVIALPASTGWLDFYLYDLKRAVAANFRIADGSLLVVGIDMKTLADNDTRWPWPRQLVAETLQRLGRLNPRGIIVDILFQNVDTEAGDVQLEQTIEKLGNLILISLIEEKTSQQSLSLARFTSLPRFSSKALAEGFVWGVINDDGRLRSFKINDERLNAQSAVLLALKHFYMPDPTFVANLLSEVPLVFARKNGGIPVISLRDIIADEKSFKEICRDKVIVLGVTAQAVHDYHNTSLGIVSGAEILAASLDTLISGRIGNILFANAYWRASMAAAGFLISWLTIMSGLTIFLCPLIFALILATLMMITELLLVHLPLAPLLAGWLITTLLLSAAKYFDNLFSLQAIQHDANNARLVQEQLLPAEELLFRNYRVFGLSKSANELGGDYFDYFVVKDRYIMVIIGDATGHGIPAALAMAIGKATVMLGLAQNFTPDQFIESINSVLFNALRRKLMMTAALLWLDTETNEFEYRNCGHPYPYFFVENGNIEQIAASGLFLGTKATYRAVKPFKGSFSIGERLLFYTDGLIESLPANRDQDAFTLFRDYLQTRPRLSPVDACHDILSHHPCFTTNQPQPDDFTVLMIERTASGQPGGV